MHFKLDETYISYQTIGGMNYSHEAMFSKVEIRMNDAEAPPIQEAVRQVEDGWSGRGLSTALP